MTSWARCWFLRYVIAVHLLRTKRHHTGLRRSSQHTTWTPEVCQFYSGRILRMKEKRTPLHQVRHAPSQQRDSLLDTFVAVGACKDGWCSNASFHNRDTLACITQLGWLFASDDGSWSGNVRLEGWGCWLVRGKVDMCLADFWFEFSFWFMFSWRCLKYCPSLVRAYVCI